MSHDLKAHSLNIKVSRYFRPMRHEFGQLNLIEWIKKNKYGTIIKMKEKKYKANNNIYVAPGIERRYV